MANRIFQGGISRRELLRGTLRWAALGGLLVLGRRVGVRSGALPPEPCPSGGACGACPRLHGCGLPRGQTARKILPGGSTP